MVEKALTVTVGGAVDECKPEALETWRRQYAPSQDLQQAYLENVTRLTLEVTVLGGGFLRVVVTVQAKRPWMSDAYFFTYRMVGGGEYVRDGKA